MWVLIFNDTAIGGFTSESNALSAGKTMSDQIFNQFPDAVGFKSFYCAVEVK